jgi:hypothetical protein
VQPDKAFHISILNLFTQINGFHLQSRNKNSGYKSFFLSLSFLQADICQLGMDQRKVNMLAREYCDDIKRKNKPIILSHRILILFFFLSTFFGHICPVMEF